MTSVSVVKRQGHVEGVDRSCDQWVPVAIRHLLPNGEVAYWASFKVDFAVSD